MIEFKSVTFAYGEEESPVFNGLDITLPHGMVSLIGQNGTGKSTMLLLAGGRLLPGSGSVRLNGRDTKEIKDEAERDRYAAFVYQNMEFETKENIGSLLEYVYKNGYHTSYHNGFIPELIGVFELGNILKRRTQEISKGELQRVILAFSLLYGTPVIMMDEPVFALEEQQKHKALEYIRTYAKQKEISVYFSLHELDLTHKYSDYMVLFYKDKPPVVDVTPVLFKPEIIEEAYQVPFHMLKDRELLFRTALVELDKKRAQRENSG